MPDRSSQDRREGQPKGAGNDFNVLQGIDTMTRISSKALAVQTRAIARGRDVLYQGTRHRELILASGLLALSNSGGVYFTRDVETAVHWATLPRDDEGEGAILVFDRPSLRARYRLERFIYAEGENEFEEAVWGRNVKIAPHLIGLTSTLATGLSRQGRARRRAGELRIARETADCDYDCGARAGTCSDCRAERMEKIATQLERTYPGIARLWHTEAE
jgi:hypothetical protein